MDWRPGDLGAETNSSFVARLIQFGQVLHGNRHWHWNHIFVVTTAAGDTVEAMGRGVARGRVGDRKVLNLGCPPGVDRQKVVAFAESKVGVLYNYLGVVLLGIDALFHTRFHTKARGPLFCSELGAEALAAGGWTSSKSAALEYPADLVDALSKGQTSRP